jgi:uncharacterized protein
LDVVLDANVVVSAAIQRAGKPAEIVRLWQADRFRWVTSTPLLEELERTLRSKRLSRYMTWDGDEIDGFLSAVRDRCIVVFPRFSVYVIKADPDDNRVLEAALEGKADFIVTGDGDLLDLKRHEGTIIVTPADFLAILAEEAMNQ